MEMRKQVALCDTYLESKLCSAVSWLDHKLEWMGSQLVAMEELELKATKGNS